MSENIYAQFDVDKSKLKRDYIQNPINNSHNHYLKDTPPKEDMEYLYLELNLNQNELCQFFNIGRNCLMRILKDLAIKKSAELNRLKHIKTNRIKYGCDYPTQSKQVKEKTEQTNIKKIGVPHYAMKPDWNQEYSAICQKKFGVDNVFQIPEIKEKIKEHWIKAEGVEFYSQTKKTS